jgi:hypothetical protein
LNARHYSGAGQERVLRRVLAIKSPELFPVCVRRQIGVEQPDQPEGDNDPAVGTILYTLA